MRATVARDRGEAIARVDALKVSRPASQLRFLPSPVSLVTTFSGLLVFGGISFAAVRDRPLEAAALDATERSTAMGAAPTTRDSRSCSMVGG